LLAEGAENVQNRIVKGVELGAPCLLIADQAADSVEDTEVKSNEDDRSDENHPELWVEGHYVGVPVGLSACRFPDEHPVTVSTAHCSTVRSAPRSLIFIFRDFDGRTEGRSMFLNKWMHCQ
jgi:hypothetical protein